MLACRTSYGVFYTLLLGHNGRSVPNAKINAFADVAMAEGTRVRNFRKNAVQYCRGLGAEVEVIVKRQRATGSRLIKALGGEKITPQLIDARVAEQIALMPAVFIGQRDLARNNPPSIRRSFYYALLDAYFRGDAEIVIADLLQNYYGTHTPNQRLNLLAYLSTYRAEGADITARTEPTELNRQRIAAVKLLVPHWQLTEAGESSDLSLRKAKERLMREKMREVQVSWAQDMLDLNSPPASDDALTEAYRLAVRTKATTPDIHEQCNIAFCFLRGRYFPAGPAMQIPAHADESDYQIP